MTQLIEVKVPDIGDFKDVPVIEVLVKPGDEVKAEDSLVTLESDKATMDVPSPAGGVVKEMRVKLGDKVGEGHVILTLETGGDSPVKSAPTAAASKPPPSPAASKPGSLPASAAPAAAPAAAAKSGTAPATPAP
ncbi:MAG: biotin/lipoyl-containing protein, partial [Betaproteobacteria bacterium]